MTKTTFSQLELSTQLLEAVTEMGFNEATDIQAEALPLIRTGADVLARSQTGTGKTVAFGIPAVECIQPEERHVQVLILSPTRELARQCGDEIRKLSKYMPQVKTADILGGSDYSEQFRKLRNANMVIGTPGRIMDHMKRGTLHMENLKMIILDEADEMLNMGFREDIEFILKDAPEQRQIVLFSATVPAAILAITKKFQNNPQRIDISRNQVTLENITQVYTNVPKQYKAEALSLMLSYYKPHRAIIFANTKSMVDELTEKLSKEGFSIEGLHGDMRQSKRTTTMNSFKSGRVNILAATDVAARGIDVSDMDYVFNFDIPRETDYYVHRIGRTGRAGKKGTAVTLCCGRQQQMQLQRLAQYTKSKISSVPLPRIEDIEKTNRMRNISVVEETLQAGNYQSSAEMVDELVKRGYSAENIAAAALGLAFRQSKRKLVNIPTTAEIAPQAPMKNERKGKVSQSEKMITVSVSIGSADKVTANHLVGAIAERTTAIGRNDLGKIRIEETTSTIAITADRLDEILDAMHGCKICGKRVLFAPVARQQQAHSKANGNRRYDSSKQRPSDRNRHDKKRSKKRY